MTVWYSADEAATERLGEELAGRLRPDGVVLLSGELGAGKTVLVRGLARGLGIAAGEIRSPTFTLVHEHRGSAGRLVHLDLYRLEPEQAEEIGLDEILAGPGVKAVEWAERLPYRPPGALHLRLRRTAGGEREIEDMAAAPGRAEES